jgi:hypothetical protein
MYKDQRSIELRGFVTRHLGEYVVVGDTLFKPKGVIPHPERPAEDFYLCENVLRAFYYDTGTLHPDLINPDHFIPEAGLRLDYDSQFLVLDGESQRVLTEVLEQSQDD